MLVKVEKCRSDKFYYRLSLPNGDREFIISDDWDRKTAAIALDRIQLNYRVKRSSIKWKHV